nr:uncharacterized protein LOC109157801 [Ipomoea batatas]
MDSSMMILFFVGSLFLQGALGDITCEYLPANVCSFAISSSGKRCLLENSVTNEGNKVEYQCKTSEVVVGSSVGEHIETDECVEACGLDRKSVGLSSDSLLESSFTTKLCSSSCYQNCPNIVDLYFNLAAGEGKISNSLTEHIPVITFSHNPGQGIQPSSYLISQSPNTSRDYLLSQSPDRKSGFTLSRNSKGVYLPDLCEKQRSHTRRDMIELKSSNGEMAPGPSSEEGLVGAPQKSPRRAMVELSSGAPTPTDDDEVAAPSV